MVKNGGRAVGMDYDNFAAKLFLGVRFAENAYSPSGELLCSRRRVAQGSAKRTPATSFVIGGIFIIWSLH